MGCCNCNSVDEKGINRIISREIIPNKKRKSNKIDNQKSKEFNTDNNIKFAKAALNKNNSYRNLHGVEPLKYDEYLFKMAFILAKQYLEEGTLENNNLKYMNHEELGMNFLLRDEKLDGDKLVDIWYDEINKPYNFNEPNEFECNNFTQMVWKKSEKFGCGYYSKEIIGDKGNNNENEEKNEKNNISKKYYYVALYYPSGNQPGEFRKNVLKRKRIKPQPEEQGVSSKETKIQSIVKSNDEQNEKKMRIKIKKIMPTKKQKLLNSILQVFRNTIKPLKMKLITTKVLITILMKKKRQILDRVLKK